MPPLHDESFFVEELLDTFQSLKIQKNIIHKKKPTRNVAFKEYSEMYFVPSLSEMTQEERDASYLTDTDYQRIKRENYETLKIMYNENPFAITETTYFRGLEASLPNARADRKQRIQFVVQNILMAQERNATIDPRWVETFAQMYTMKTLEAAFRMANFDWQAASMGI
jgi:hypothetical protein